MDSFYPCKSFTVDKSVEINSEQQRLHYIGFHPLPGNAGLLYVHWVRGKKCIFLVRDNYEVEVTTTTSLIKMSKCHFTLAENFAISRPHRLS